MTSIDVLYGLLFGLFIGLAIGGGVVASIRDWRGK